MNYPQDALEGAIQGKVYIGFTVLEDGSIANTNVKRGVHTSLDKESIRLIQSMPKWEPAESNGKKVASEYTLPVYFRLN
jgi:protein TonB